uniref:Ribonuclease n=1 Tax=Tetraselmis chuii TaxID=63592 RepID=A0A6U1K634_9CHLO|mmetsp:Transcript_39651/g.71135  ORF Transcript_39651/g.71135 Transcript_39651/m.71135 type:complete len:110 (+) Transcript_39651:280-609(+)
MIPLSLQSTPTPRSGQRQHLVVSYNVGNALKQKTKVDKTSAKAGPTKALEMELWGKGCMLIAGTDEAGRGPLAGPVVAAACCIPQDVVIEGVADRWCPMPAQLEVGVVV